ncbi:hypothetical protein NFI96_008145 [Prochilodus magdalenae]|nr:hypothetical protein NFI96_008145 [Prochilodus magdalenae]
MSLKNLSYDLPQNPGYFDIPAQDVSVWHVPNNEQMDRWGQTAFLRYHTETKFLKDYGGNLFQLFTQLPVRHNAGSCIQDNGPSIPVVYDVGDAAFNHNLYGPNSRAETEPGFVTFRVFNNERNALAMCSALKPVYWLQNACNTEHYCIGGGYISEPLRCGDFAGFDNNGYGNNIGWSASQRVTEAAVLLFYR